MNTPTALYNALKSINISDNAAKAVLEAWESDMKKLTLKSDLQPIELNNHTLIKEAERKIQSSITDQFEKLWLSLIKTQTKVDIIYPPALLLIIFIFASILLRQLP